MNLHTFVVLVENKPGVLTRVSSLIRRRGFNIESLTVGHAETEGVSRVAVTLTRARSRVTDGRLLTSSTRSTSISL